MAMLLIIAAYGERGKGTGLHCIGTCPVPLGRKPSNDQMALCCMVRNTVRAPTNHKYAKYSRYVSLDQMVFFF